MKTNQIITAILNLAEDLDLLCSGQTHAYFLHVDDEKLLTVMCALQDKVFAIQNEIANPQ